MQPLVPGHWSAGGPRGCAALAARKKVPALSGGRCLVRPWDDRSRGDTTMKVMVLIKASKDSEAGVMPSQQLLADMGKFNEELVKAGVMLAGEGLHPTSKGARVRFSGKERAVSRGPFGRANDLLAGFWLWQVKSLDEAIDWVKRCPSPHNEDCEIEIRQVFAPEDFGAALTPELREQEERLRKR
jgi:hypothetical protein